MKKKFKFIVGSLSLLSITLISSPKHFILKKPFSPPPVSATTDDEKEFSVTEEDTRGFVTPNLESEPLSNANIIYGSTKGSEPSTNATDTKASAKQTALVTLAYAQLGKPYYYGATGSDRFDCSSLVQYVYKTAINMSLPRTTTEQEKQGTEVSLGSLKVGDLLFWGTKGNSQHVGIYIGNGQYIHASSGYGKVVIGSRTTYKPQFARRVLSAADLKDEEPPSTVGQASNERYIFRLYNPNSGLHHYTSSVYEATQLKIAGWTYERVGWVAPTTGTAVYRLYNPNNGLHHYTTSTYERDSLVKAGWKNEGTAWMSGGSVADYRLYNPNSGEHHYTTSAAEKNNLVKVGWNYENIGWYAVRTF
ncbi:NlpC/P60 family protein [Lactococcus taiwanensis]|uniref:NlpC/P60 family protein n=1 Tax=Lactococcus taiwanensis TaxID=1151742 RepID=UPI00190835ED|nr:NlpC/P60 family protein [Lactococcus taiwanensis]